MSARLLISFAVLVASGLLHCNRLFWRERSDFHSAHWIEAHRVMEVRLLYAEKTPWDLLAGTTLKKDLRTRLFEMVREGGVFRVEQESSDLPGQPEYDLGYFQDEVVFLQRSLLADGNLTPPQLFSWNPRSRSLRKRWDDRIAGFTLRGFILSPDNRRLLLRLEKDRREAFLMLEDWQEAPGKPLIVAGVSEIAWHPDGSQVFFRRSGEVLHWDGKTTVQKAALFPRCFHPATRWGQSRSPAGETYTRENPDSAAEISGPSGKPFGSQGMISDLRKIGMDCE